MTRLFSKQSRVVDIMVDLGKCPVFRNCARSLLVGLRLLAESALSLWCIVDWAGRDDNVPVLGVKLLAPDQAGSVLFGTLVDDGVRVLGNGLDLDRDWLWVLYIIC